MHQEKSELRELARIIGKALLQFANQPSSKRRSNPFQYTSEECTTKPVMPEPEAGFSAEAEWLRINDVKKYFGIKRSHLYQLINDGAIRSVCLRRRGYIRGVRLIHRDSVAHWIESNERT